MAVDDGSLQPVRVVEEFVADPQQVGGDLTLQRQTRAHARMDEDIVAIDDHQFQLAQEGLVGRWEGGAEGLTGLLPDLRLSAADRALHAVGRQGLAAAIFDPGGSGHRIVEEVQQRLLVIAHQGAEFEAALGGLRFQQDQPIDHRRGLSAAVDIVAQHDQHRRVLAARGPIVFGHRPDQAVQKVEPPVHVPHGVNHSTARGRRVARLGLRTKEGLEHRTRQDGDKRQDQEP